jgi:hypothetical protein
MTRTARLAALGGTCIALLAGCGSTATTSPTPTASPTPIAAPTATVSATAGPVTQADLQAVYARLFPTSPSGGDCVGGTSTPSWAACPLTPRLIAALDASLAAQSGPGGEPLCGCQAFDPSQQASYSVGAPPGGGTIHVAGFGTPHIAYAVIASGGAFLVDDIIYCSPTPHSIYPNETVSSC